MTESKGMTIALPSGKSMEEQTLALLNAAHVTVQRAHPRRCTAGIAGLPGVDRAVFFKPSQIPALVSGGDVALGITGMDAVLENGGYDNLQIVAHLPYSKVTNGGTRCVIFTRENNPANSFQDIPEGERIVSEYPKETESFLRQHQVPGLVIPCTGSAESFVVLGKYSYGVALTETGTSLRANSLKEIGEIFVSETILVVNESIYTKNKEAIDFLGQLLRGVLEARDKVYLLMNVPTRVVGEVSEMLPALKAPTIQALADPTHFAVASVVPREKLNGLKLLLARLGVTGFVELDPGSVM
ncbi:ATP phosphoribosyltransferase [Candidatus Parcubacteria bacterium]|nr:MAG: ATP phosphoribosyltransferase [Candidatus Parcubacteria bacterium]